jgi:hypothetical protein
MKISYRYWPILVDLQSKTPVCGSSITGIADSNPTEGMIARSVLFFFLYVVVGSGLCDGADHSFRGVCFILRDLET